MEMMKILQEAINHKASDLHLTCGEAMLMRIDGTLQKVSGSQILDEEELKKLLSRILPATIISKIDQICDLDLAVNVPNLTRVRINLFRQYHGLSAAIRIFPTKIPSLAELNLPPIVSELCTTPHGLIVVTGPTGSGKSTTLAAMLDHINNTQKSHIITIEDPIEYLHTSKNSLVQQRQVKEHTTSFESALRAALREDPNYILIGEMRDLETMRLALTAAETGHLVLSTLHTNSAAETVNRIIDAFPAAEKNVARSILSGALKAVIAQVLVNKNGGGRVAAQEIMLCNTAIRNLIREDKIAQIYSAIQTGQSQGMRTLEQHLEALKRNGTIAA